ncbi:MAG: type II toxin-antitoxin system RelE/ParE family toxin [Caldilineaceae bacterium]|nr:type II toxin-antitoxin system RelE/ParE family toxin [Caldilineaceae bacterium]
MIEHIRHRGLKRLYEKGDRSGIGADMRGRIERILLILDQAETIADMDIPGYRLHTLTGNRQGTWSIRVTGNWRITFRFENGNVFDLDLEDYH